ncbi:hypothetical protein KDA_00230 [Dictyobacter alpinus]|uniref:Uncharacterized protein n=1 Tax=Dictyobacter alpinus TaxID=2014873 RepID=A0A402AZI1_9CHLR|nr:hypothetical protein KDA_00230 [Dictyobacter alpinus]
MLCSTDLRLAEYNFESKKTDVLKNALAVDRLYTEQVGFPIAVASIGPAQT